MQISFKNLVRSDRGRIEEEDAKLYIYQNSRERSGGTQVEFRKSRGRGLGHETIYYNEYCLSRLESRIPRNTL